ncbi:MAG: aminopeptidase P family protein [Anaerolineae bacterium]|nr:aminopeptidase P family protein [Anaerolineae bacterium]
MKTDVDALMQEHNIDYLLVTGSGRYNPYMVYLTGGGHFSEADLIKKRGEGEILFHSPIERDEAAKTGLVTRSFADYPISELLKESGGDFAVAFARRYRRIFEDLGICEGRVAIFGQTDLGRGYAIFRNLAEMLPNVEFVGLHSGNLLMRAMATKSYDEVERIRRVGTMTVQVVGRTADFLSQHRVRDGVLMQSNGEVLTVGDVKRQVRLWLAEADVELPEGMIFSIGYDSAVPHSCGNSQDVLRVGETIVFDIYPSEAGGGYFYDMTRTWCLGYATDEALELHAHVLHVLECIEREVTANVLFKEYHRKACELFVAKGHPTILDNPQTEEGYVHSLGHGVGLHIHEKPFSGILAAPEDVLVPGSVFTLEPGLYYPKHGIGVRVEDTYWMLPDGRIEVLANYPRDLVLDVKW